MHPLTCAETCTRVHVKVYIYISTCMYTRVHVIVLLTCRRVLSLRSTCAASRVVPLVWCLSPWPCRMTCVSYTGMWIGRITHLELCLVAMGTVHDTATCCNRLQETATDCPLPVLLNALIAYANTLYRLSKHSLTNYPYIYLYIMHM